MSDNPYAPPKAAVSEVVMEPPATRPPEVTRAVRILWISLVISDALSIADRLASQRPEDWGELLVMVTFLPIGVLIAWWIYGKILKGRNWARILLLIGVFMAPFGIYTVLTNPVYATHRTLPLIAQVVTLPLSVWACWLMFSSPGKEWFRKRPT